METQTLKMLITSKREEEFIQLLHSGLDPNFEGGWPLRLAARYGCSIIVEKLLQYGANPHLLDEAGASTLQLAVYSDAEWNTDRWKSLLSCCDSSQLADGAAVAIIFNNVMALKTILETGRCNMHVPTTLTGKTVEVLAKGYKVNWLLSSPTFRHERSVSLSPRSSRSRTLQVDSSMPSYQTQRTLSPSVARFFHQTTNISVSPSRIDLSESSSRRTFTSGRNS